MDPNKYKAYHEAAMSNNTGNSLEQTTLCICLACVLVVVVAIGRRQRSQWYQLLIEYAGLILPIVFSYTLFSSYIIEITIFSIGLLYVQSVFYLNHSGAMRAVRAFSSPNTFSHRRMECVTNQRGVTYIMTVYCILAVDFASFPRSFAKTERYGFSLMDTGVGFFTFCSGIVHKSYVNPRVSVIMKDNYKLLMVPALGLTRTFLIKTLDYHEHVTEYGVHWNFFYTLAVAKLISTVLLHVTPKTFELPLCGAVLIIHQVVLKSGVEDWVFSDTPRDNFLNANREGIGSILGYVFLYLFGYYMKTILTDQTISKSVVILKLSIFCVLSSAVMLHTNILYPVSRTLTNSGFCVYLIVILLVNLIFFYVMEVVLHENQVTSVPIIFEAFNRNGLFLFVLGNLLTGMINMSCQTLLVKSWMTIAILITYMTILFWVAVFLNKRSITVL